MLIDFSGDSSNWFSEQHHRKVLVRSFPLKRKKNSEIRTALFSIINGTTRNYCSFTVIRIEYSIFRCKYLHWEGKLNVVPFSCCKKMAYNKTLLIRLTETPCLLVSLKINRKLSCYFLIFCKVSTTVCLPFDLPVSRDPSLSLKDTTAPFA